VSRDTLGRLRAPLVMAPAAAPATPVAEAEDPEAARIRAALARTGGNVVRAAKVLGLGRNALRHRMRRHGIGRPPLDELETAAPPPRRTRRAPVREETDGERRWEQKPVAVLAIDLVVPERVVEPWTAARRWETKITERVAGFEGRVVTRAPSR